MRKYYSMLCLLTLTCCQSEAFAQIDEIELPENASTAWVANQINQNGMLLSIKTFKSIDEVDDVLSFYRNRWHVENEVPGYVEDKLADWHLISRLEEGGNTVLQLKPADTGGSVGFLSFAHLHDDQSVPSLGLPKPESTDQYATSYIEERGTQATTMTLISKQAPSDVLRFYRKNLTSKGWLTVLDDEYHGSSVLIMNKNKKQIEVVIQELNVGDSVIFLNHVHKDV